MTEGRAPSPGPPVAGAAEPDVLAAEPPRFTLDEASDLAQRVFGVRGSAAALDSERDQNFRIDADGGRFLLKLSNAAETLDGVAYETEALLHVLATDPGLPVAEPCPALAGGHWTTVAGAGGATHYVRLFTFMEGRHFEPGELEDADVRAFGATLARLGRALRGFWHPGGGRRLLWDGRHAARLRPLLDHVDERTAHALATRALDRFEDHALPVLPSLRTQSIHNDFTLDNVLLDDRRRVGGIVDFGDLAHTALVCDVSTAMASLVSDRGERLRAAAALVEGYSSVVPLEAEEVEVLPDLLGARLVALIAIAAWRVRRFPDNEPYIVASVASARDALRWLVEEGFDAVASHLHSAAGLARPAPPASAASTAQLVARRARVLGSALSPLTYDRPLHLVRGEGVWLFDVDGRAYLDAYNNVPVVGHSHPRVVEAIAAQARTLNTNLRYLHENAIALAERLCASMPGALDTCMFVNSGSEANDLAWRLATAAGATGGIVTAHAYHGVTTAIAALSPEEWVGGQRPSHVATIPAPDPFAGPHRGADWPRRYAASLDDAVAELAARGMSPAAVFLDAGLTSDGILAPPPGYGEELVRRTHAAGALFVADEVQTGFGRIGGRMWGFEALGIEPDVVTLGKPMGNGHPVAAVVTRADIVDGFARTAGFFSTFGGNPVACAAAGAVLDVIEDEALVARAARMGSALRAAVESVCGGHPSVGEVRGRGLLLGIAFVEHPESRAPDGRAAARVANAMRERGVLVGTTGPHGNVLKVRPPLVLEEGHVALLAEALAGALGDVS
ncbi:MAG TPA: aminotransferase class III-fold pyridoxal phosphate-dependent enzyme [Actinomycetota bacterium]|nr:aminotransferase class III-fold pyridoxal phosphate-dependent enzyme [Actinomycetota bacterium]